MGDNVLLNAPDIVGGQTIATDEISSIQHQLVKLEYGGDGLATMVSPDNPLPVTDAVAEASLASILAKISSDPATQTTLAALLAKVIAAPSTEAKQDSIITLLNAIGSLLAGTLTVTGTVNANTGLSQPLTDTQLRATPVPVSGTVTAAPTGTQNVDVTANTIGLSTASKQDAQTALLTTIDADTSNLDVALSTRLKAADTLAAITLISDIRQATAGNLNMTEASAAAIKTAVETIDNFISGSRGLVTEDNSAAIKTAVEVIDNFISGNRGLVTEDNSAAIKTAVEIVDDWDESDRAKVNLIVGQAGITAGAGAVAANTPRVTHASDDPVVTALQIIDDWDESDRAKVNLIAGQAGVSASDGNTDAATQRVVIAANVLSSVNSSATPLSEFGVYTGTSEDIMSYNEVRITVYSDVVSLPDGLSIQQSTDNVNWTITDTYTIAAATGKTFSVPRQARYFRVVYSNSYTAQATFILQTSYTRIGGKSSSQRPNDNYTNQTDLEQQQAFLMNYNSTTDSWYRVRGDATNGIAVNPNGFNTDTQRRLQEQVVLEMYEDSNRNLYNTESYTSGRRGFELR